MYCYDCTRRTPQNQKSFFLQAVMHGGSGSFSSLLLSVWIGVCVCARGSMHMPIVHTYLFLYVLLNFALALQAQLCIILWACVVYKRGDLLAAVQPQLSHRCQFWMAYHQVGSNCFQAQRPEQETEWQLCYVDCCCRVGCCMLPLQSNGSSIKQAGSDLQLVIQRSEARERLTLKDQCMLFMHVIMHLHA